MAERARPALVIFDAGSTLVGSEGARHGAGSRRSIVSGGIRSALLPVAAPLGIPPRDVYGAGMRFADDSSPDREVRTDGAADRFIAYTGFVRHDAPVHGAHARCDSSEAPHALRLPRP